jgi:hypothetical protein
MVLRFVRRDGSQVRSAGWFSGSFGAGFCRGGRALPRTLLGSVRVRRRTLTPALSRRQRQAERLTRSRVKKDLPLSALPGSSGARSPESLGSSRAGSRRGSGSSDAGRPGVGFVSASAGAGPLGSSGSWAREPAWVPSAPGSGVVPPLRRVAPGGPRVRFADRRHGGPWVRFADRASRIRVGCKSFCCMVFSSETATRSLAILRNLDIFLFKRLGHKQRRGGDAALHLPPREVARSPVNPKMRMKRPWAPSLPAWHQIGLWVITLAGRGRSGAATPARH